MSLHWYRHYKIKSVLAFINGGGGNKRDIPKDSRNFDEFTIIKRSEWIIGDEISVKRRVIGENGIARSAWEWLDDVSLLKFGNVEASKAGKCIGFARASRFLYQVIILVLTLFNSSDCSE